MPVFSLPNAVDPSAIALSPAAAVRPAAGYTLYHSVLIPRILAHLEALGHDLRPLLGRFELPANAAELPEVRVELDALVGFTEAAAALTQDPLLGFHVARNLPRGAFGLAEFVSRSASNLRQALREVIRYSALLGSGAIFSLEEGVGESFLEHKLPGELLCMGRQPNEFALTIFLGIGSQLLDKAWKPTRVWFAHPKPQGELSEILDYLGTSNVEWGRGSNGFAFPSSDLDRPLTSSDPDLHRVLEGQARQAVEARPAGNAFVAEVREQARLALRESGPNVERVAKALGVSPRTLQRRLNEQGTTFQDVLDDVRHTLAKHYLANPKMGQAEVAWLLGYSEQAAFARAFRRWAKTTPGAFRASALGANRRS
jgi:AraC-like DNA-binding protein